MKKALRDAGYAVNYTVMSVSAWVDKGGLVHRAAVSGTSDGKIDYAESSCGLVLLERGYGLLDPTLRVTCLGCLSSGLP